MRVGGVDSFVLDELGQQLVGDFVGHRVIFVHPGAAFEGTADVALAVGVIALARIDQAAIDAAGRKLYPNAAASTLNRQVYTPISAVLHHAARRGWDA